VLEAREVSILSHLFLSEFILASIAYFSFYEDLWFQANKILFLFCLAFCLIFPFPLLPLF
jgi:hypothetical protein